MRCKTTTLLALALALAVAGCSDSKGGTDAGSTSDQSTTFDDKGSLQFDKGVAQKDKGTTQNDLVTVNKDTGVPHKDALVVVKDKGVPHKDKNIPNVDKGMPHNDKGTVTPPACGPEFDAKAACGGNPAGTWEYVKGCVEPSAFAKAKQACPGLKVSGVTFAVNPQFNSLYLGAAGALTMAIKGTVKATGVWPKSCAKLGCKVLEGTIKLLQPQMTATCLAASTGDCTCKLAFPVAGVAAGTYKTSGGTLTAAVAGQSLPYHYCVKGKVLRYRGTPQHPTDRDITYVLSKK